MAEFLWYLASPYSYKHEDKAVVNKILDARFRQVSADAADLIRAGLRVFSPIAHTHPIAEYGTIDHGDHTIWLPADKAIFSRCNGIIVDMLPGWDKSYGVGEELRWAEEHGMVIAYYTPKKLLPELAPVITGTIGDPKGYDVVAGS